MLFNLTVCLQHLTAAVLNSLEEATLRKTKMASPAASVTLSPEVSAILISTFSSVISLHCACCSPAIFPAGPSPAAPLPPPPPGPHRSAAPASGEGPASVRGSAGATPPRRRALPRCGAGAGGGGPSGRGPAAAEGGMLGARCGPFPPPRRLLPFKHPGRGCACCRSLPFKSRLPPPPSPEPPPEPARRRHGLLDHLPPRGVSAGRRAGPP